MDGYSVLNSVGKPSFIQYTYNRTVYSKYTIRVDAT